MNKKCIVCDVEIPVVQKRGFSKRIYCSKQCKNRAYRNHRLEFQKKERALYPERVKARQKRWRENHLDQIKESTKLYRLKANGVYSALKAKGRHPVRISREDFCKWYEATKKECYYCGIPEEKMQRFPQFFNGSVNLRFSVDRVDNNKGYEKGNMVLACRRCNSIKSDFFTAEEMQNIAKLHIRPKWEESI